MARSTHRGRPGTTLDALPRKLVAAMIVAGGVLTLVSFAKYLDHGQLVSDFVSRVQEMTAR